LYSREWKPARYASDVVRPDFALAFGPSLNPMSSPTDCGEQPHIISLVLQSRKALQQGESLCSRSNATATSSAKEATDLLALNAKIQWISNAVIEQLKA
jgi:hypothetical protein